MTESSEPSTTPIFECILAAPTTVGILQGHPSMTYLDCGTEYLLKLRKINEKLYGDQLFVSLRFCLSLPLPDDDEEESGSGSSAHELQCLESRLLERWKQLHPRERLFDLYPRPQGSSNSLTNAINDIRAHSEEINVASFSWCPAKSDQDSLQEAALAIRFNCVSSQFVRKHAAVPVDCSFLLHVEIVSQNTCVVLDSVAAQVKLFWPNGADRANHRDYLQRIQRENVAPFSPGPSSSHAFFSSSDPPTTSGLYIPSCEYTKLAPLKSANPEHFYQSLPNDYFDDFESFILCSHQQQQKHSVQNSKKLYRNLANRRNQLATLPNSILYILHDMANYLNFEQQKFGSGDMKMGSFKGVFMDVGSHIKLELKPNPEMIKQPPHQCIIHCQLITLQLRLLSTDGVPFEKIDLISWELNDPPHHMIELDCGASRLSDNVLDIRRLSTNWIEIVYVARCDRSEMFALKVNTSSVEVSSYSSGSNVDHHLLGPAGTLFQLQIDTSLKRNQTVLDQIRLAVFTTKEGESERVKQKWIDVHCITSTTPTSSSHHSNPNSSTTSSKQLPATFRNQASSPAFTKSHNATIRRTSSTSSSPSLTILNDLSDHGSSTSSASKLTNRLNRSSRLVMWHLFYSAMRLTSSAIAKECFEFMFTAYQEGRWFECGTAFCLATVCFWFFIWN